MTTINQEPIQTPCIGVCTMSEASGFCQGCFRTIEEIREWWDMSADMRNTVMLKLEERQIALTNFD